MKELPFNASNRGAQKRLRSALGMTVALLDDKSPRPIGTRYIDKFYTGQSNPISRWLRDTLLIVHDETWSIEHHKCKTYTYNRRGVEIVKQILNDPPKQIKKPKPITDNKQIALDWVQDTFDLSNIEYTDKSNRLWNPIQNIPRNTRKRYFFENEFPCQYDIVCAAPSLLHQYSWRQSDGLVLDVIDTYIANRSAIRKRIADDVELPEQNIKQLINSLFAGASLGYNTRFNSWTLCNEDRSKVEWLKQDPFIIGLREDITTMWEYLRPELPVIVTTSSTGRTRNVQMSSKNKWELYFRLERQVVDAIRSYLDHHGIHYFLLHDAFVSEDLSADMLSGLVQWVYDRTMFVIDLDKEFNG